jgi:hypothetical protein
LVGGLLFAQVVTLYITPVFYTYMDTFLKWRTHKRPEAIESSVEPVTHT